MMDSDWSDDAMQDSDTTEIAAEGDELFEHYRTVVDKGQELLRIDKFLQNRLEKTSRTRIQAAADTGNIHVNGKPVKSNYRVKPGDVVAIVFARPPREIELKPEPIPLEVVFEDDTVIVINKQAGLVVHPGYGNYSGTLVNALMYHFQHVPIYSQNDPRPGLVHRLDKNTSGIMVLAKSEYALAHLARQFFERTTERTYQALVWGNVAQDEGTITGHIGRDVRDRKLFAVYADGSQGKHAVTHYKVLERFGYLTWIECKLETGRTHQIRVHLKHIGHTLFNDDTYGGDAVLKGLKSGSYAKFIENCFGILPRHALHAKSLGFIHPNTAERLFFDSDIPADMAEVRERLRKFSKSQFQA